MRADGLKSGRCVSLEAARAQLEAAIETAIEVLDALDADADLEDGDMDAAHDGREPDNCEGSFGPAYVGQGEADEDQTRYENSTLRPSAY